MPGGFHHAGTGLHYTALNGHRAMVEFLLAQGADRELKDTKVGSTAAGWAEYGHIAAQALSHVIPSRATSAGIS